MSQQITESDRRVFNTRQVVVVSGGRKAYFTTTSPAETYFGWHRAVRKGNMIYVSGVTAIREDVVAVGSSSDHEDAATSNDRKISHARPQALVPSGSGFTVVSADDLDRSRLQTLHDDGAEKEQPPPYDMSEPGSSNPRQTQSESVVQVLYPNDAKQQAIVAMDRCIEAVQSLHGKREDIAKVKMVITKHEDRRKVSEAFRECFSVNAPLTTARAHGKKTGRAGVRVSEVGAALTILVIPGSLPDPDLLVEVEAEAVLDDRL